MAARAIAYTGDSRGEPLLRYKAHLGDKDPQVLAECFLALLRLEPKGSVEFVAAYLESSDAETVEAAAIALGESRTHEALLPLQSVYSRTVGSGTRRTFLFAIAALRCDGAVEFLLGELANAEGQTAEAILAALATFRNDQSVCKQVADIVDRKRDRQLAEAFRDSFRS